MADKRQNNQHKPRKNCKCTTCKTMRETGCLNPHKCYVKAEELLDTLPPKWNPRGVKPEDYEPGEIIEQNPDDSLNFDHRLTTRGNLREIFRIFTEGTTTNDLPEY
ncbi:hypothetical protein PUNSTDRAFT_63914, partial [Punctularia strigosozonata HHB-11173 SS5]|uniref:uncharacterized protein n=1 Tax=Punctularia strigosozonata (strain HHB-11173) TaxID=741275 RepID=UPI0004417935